ncbi:hypothetical protein HID58_075363 [Brassica napus]|uniref:Uncharacterized protein n=1 Tax=Brassica napus TaxID=3708 RepID=A0ABQ7YJD7_BRANA|nr:hypothetical protein HID58_075363 [Brassica napus]
MSITLGPRPTIRSSTWEIH